MDDGGVVGGSCVVECFVILLLVQFVGVPMSGESGFFE